MTSVLQSCLTFVCLLPHVLGFSTVFFIFAYFFLFFNVGVCQIRMKLDAALFPTNILVQIFDFPSNKHQVYI